MARQTTLLALVLKADPDWNRESRFVVEYEFSAPGRRSSRTGDLTHENGRRVFRGYESRRGPYADD